ncbi:MAG: response regulator transcription factor [Clostridia bacterium]|nr:response regulator transcription factor [Clostridia bacterium]
MNTILVVEDQKSISDVVSKYIENEGYRCVVASNGIEALEIFGQNKYDLIVLDVMMPGIDGFEVLENIRQFSNVPVIMLTARLDESDKIRGFDLGADDYVIKPFSARELMRRIHAVLKRVNPTAGESQLLVYKNIKLDQKAMTAYKNGEAIDLTTAEYKLLLTFLKHTGQVLTREQIIEQAYGEAYEGYDRSVDSYIKRLRQKIENDPKNPDLLVTKYGAGYRFGGESE